MKEAAVIEATIEAPGGGNLHVRGVRNSHGVSSEVDYNITFEAISMNLKAIVLLVQLLLSAGLLRPVPSSWRQRAGGRSKTELYFLPQAVFAAGCAGAVIAYVYFNIDSIKEQQRVAIDKAMSEQSTSIKTAQEQQRQAIEKAQREQEEAIRKIREMRK